MSTNDVRADTVPVLPDPLERESGTGTSASEQPYIFKHRPKVDGDPWEVLLKPELEADTERCNAWKEEVQTLLIFAGLFSAVVTAFVIESYKFLQPDPNAAVIGLLFHIASSANNSSPFPPSVDPSSISTPFSRTSSSIRVNVFWFLSLILSLTTVLVGTIALQWLREHQSYPNFSGKEKMAILHMRLQALDAWYVPHIFAGLPLLLQGALALFLAGMIDFSLPLGKKLAVPVALIVSLTLFFLAATTTLPTFQALSFFVRDIIYPRKSVPTPCSYKSPQSQAFRVLTGVLVTGFFHLFPKFTVQEDNCDDDINPPCHLAPSIYLLWDKNNWQSWPAFDREWISLRDACHQRIYDMDPYIYQHRKDWEKEFPLSDTLQVLVKLTQEAPSAKHTPNFLAAVMHCFEDLSKSVWTNQATNTSIYKRQDRHNNYFEQLLSYSQSIAKWLLHGGLYEYNQVHYTQLLKYSNSSNILLCQWDQTFFFLSLLLEKHDSFDLAQYNIELGMQILSKSHILPLSPRNKSHTVGLFFLSSYPNYRALEYIGRKSIDQKFSSVASILDIIFKAAALHQIHDISFFDALCTHSAIFPILCRLADITADLRNQESGLNQQQVQEITSQYIASFKFIANHLNKEMSTSVLNSWHNIPSVLFYLASFFIWQLLSHITLILWLEDIHIEFGQEFRLLLEAVLQYQTWRSGWMFNVLEQQFAESDHFWPLDKNFTRFSEDWWQILFDKGLGMGLEVAKSHETTSIEEHMSNSDPGPSSHHDNSALSLKNNVTDPSITSSSPSPSQYHGTAASPTPTGQPSASFSMPHGQHHDPIAGDCHNGESQEVLSDPPASAHHIVTVDDIENLSPSPSKLSQNEPHKPESDRSVSEPGPIDLPLLTMSAKFDITGDEAPPPVINKEQTSTTPTDGTGMRDHVAINIDSPERAKEIAAIEIVGVLTPHERDGLHMAIDVENRIVTDDIELAGVGRSRESQSQDEPGGDAIVLKEPTK